MNAPVRFTGLPGTWKASWNSQTVTARLRRTLAKYEWRPYEAERVPVTLPVLTLVARADARMKALDLYLHQRRNA